MKKSAEYSSFFVVTVGLLVITIFQWGCSTPTSDPLAGFHWSSLVNLDRNISITDDYKSYIRTLSPDEQKRAGPIHFFEDGNGRHAVEIDIGINGIAWEHVLIYDGQNNRIRTVKYSIGHYSS